MKSIFVLWRSRSAWIITLVVVINGLAGCKMAPPEITLTPPVTHTVEGNTWIRPADGMVMVYIPAGEFLMGSTDEGYDAGGDEKPQHAVHLDGFWIDRTEVTNSMFLKFLQNTSYEYDRSLPDGIDEYPVVNVSWNDAIAYCEWAGGSLPTEAQWEKAARGTDGRIYPWGDQKASCEYAVMDEGRNGCGITGAWPVGSKPAGGSPYGLLDMAGNVSEWVLDWYQYTYYQNTSGNNPNGPVSGDERVLRGGSWRNISDLIRSANRTKADPTVRVDFFGFRCAR